jgi:putative SOS response-associated peptidase YedK
MGLAGLCSTWHSEAGEVVNSFTLLTVNADAHPFMRNYHRPGAEKRMVVALREEQYDDWLNTTADQYGVSEAVCGRWFSDRCVGASSPTDVVVP